MVPELLQGKRRKMTTTEDDGENEEEEDEGGSENEDRTHESENFRDEPKQEVPDVKIEMDVEQQIRPDLEATGYRGDRSLGAIPKDVAPRPSVIMFRRGSEHMASHVQRERESKEGELTPIVPGYGGMTVSGDICNQYFLNLFDKQYQLIHLIFNLFNPTTYIYILIRTVKLHSSPISNLYKFYPFIPIQIQKTLDCSYHLIWCATLHLEPPANFS